MNRNLTLIAHRTEVLNLKRKITALEDAGDKLAGEAHKVCVSLDQITLAMELLGHPTTGKTCRVVSLSLQSALQEWESK